MPKVKKQDKSTELGIKHAFGLFAYLFVVWGFYRLLFKLPDQLEEFLIKPVLWVLPIVYLLYKENKKLLSIGLTLNNLFSSLYYSLALGSFFVIEAIVSNFIKYGGVFNFSANIGELPILPALVLSFATSVSEEITFRGYIFTRIWNYTKNELASNLVTSFMWTLIHVPITFFVWKLDPSAAGIYLLLTAMFGMGSAFVFGRTKNIASSVLLHILWQWPIILFR